VNEMFLYSTVSTLKPIVGIVVTISPSFSLYRIVVLPTAPSQPSESCYSAVASHSTGNIPRGCQAVSSDFTPDPFRLAACILARCKARVFCATLWLKCPASEQQEQHREQARPLLHDQRDRVISLPPQQRTSAVHRLNLGRRLCAWTKARGLSRSNKPAASSPTIRIRISCFEKRRWNTRENASPILVLRTQRTSPLLKVKVL
jgi:hypothetical protein